MITVLLTLLAAGVAFYTESIGAVFTFVLNLTAGVGPVYLLRWFWRRVNAWTEIAAMTASLPLILFRPQFFSGLGIPQDPMAGLLYMVLGSAFFWVPATFLTPAVPEEVLDRFFARIGSLPWRSSLAFWLLGTLGLFAALIIPLQILFYFF